MTTLSGPMLPPHAGEKPRLAVVLLHGYGSDGNDLIALGQHWSPLLPQALFVAPNAPEPAAQNPAGYQWFPISFERDRLARRQEGVIAARPVLVRFLEDLRTETGLGAGATILAGFSQGAMLALHVGLSLPEPPLGIIAFSGAFLAPAGFGSGPHPPVCLVHGDLDTVVEPAHSAEAAAALEGVGVAVEHHVSSGTGHGIAPDGLAAATRFLLARAAEIQA